MRVCWGISAASCWLLIWGLVCSKMFQILIKELCAPGWQWQGASKMFSLGSWHGPACPRESLPALPSHHFRLQTKTHPIESQKILSWKGLTRINEIQLLALHRTLKESHHVSENIVQTPPELCQGSCCANWNCILEKKVIKSTGLNCIIFWNSEKGLQPI